MAWGGFVSLQVDLDMLVSVTPSATRSEAPLELVLVSRSAAWQSGTVSGARVGKLAAGWDGTGVVVAALVAA